MKNCKKSSGLTPLQLTLIIVGAIIAAVGIMVLIMQICKKKCNKNAIDACCCECEPDELDGWEIDDDILRELDFDDEDECDCDCCCDECDCEADALEAESDAENNN